MENMKWLILLGLNCRKSIILVKIKYILLLKEKEDLEDPSTGKRKSKPLNQNLPHLIPILELNKHNIHVITCFFILGKLYNMALLMLLGYLVCNVLLAWATLQQPYISKTLLAPWPWNSNKWVHLVIFEPQPKIQLTHSFLDFQPFLQGFQSVNKYLNDLWTDINNPSYFWNLFLPFAHVLINPTLNDSHIENFLSSSACHHCPYACQVKMKFEQFRWEIHYVMEVFRITYKRFLTAIDHIDYHPSQMENNKTRTKGSVLYEISGQYHTPTKMLTPSEESFLNAFMKALYKINPSLHNKLSRMKRVGIFTWILGWGVFSNARNVAKIKDNLCTLHQQNKLQDKQIKHLAKYLNLTMYQVNEHSEMLYEMDTKMLIMNKT